MTSQKVLNFQASGVDLHKQLNAKLAEMETNRERQREADQMLSAIENEIREIEIKKQQVYQSSVISVNDPCRKRAINAANSTLK